MEVGGRYAAGSQPLPMTQRAKSSTPTLLPNGIVPTGRPVKRSGFNKSVRTSARGLPQSSSAAR
jgi:hypothetical protein